ncbi:hypothetical protein DFP72DRAFT_890257 [Ephemerocybe angulata]|uniref:Uncharacterized protein n=1 Tax=Ephemerocybe angulata TaxID=980116 RepID=A0A8H6M995_9AGAR|nr:hypothetical protein DFP72DRAFT_890257 [Tulosesus angulatus]
MVLQHLEDLLSLLCGLPSRLIAIEPRSIQESQELPIRKCHVVLRDASSRRFLGCTRWSGGRGCILDGLDESSLACVKPA